MFFKGFNMGALLWAVIIVILAHFHSNAAAGSDECPEPEDIYPCYCEEDEPPLIHCNHMTSEDQIIQGLKGLKEFKIWKVSFWRNQLSLLKSNTFQGLSIQRLNFENSTLKLESPQFVGLEESLLVVYFSGCFNSTYPMPKWSLGHMEKLRELSIDRGKISSLPDDWLAAVHPSLRHLTLTENGIESLGDKVFAKVESLTFLYLDDNKLRTLKRSMFPSPAKDLRTINLNHNLLESLPDDIFKDMPYLRTVELEGNALKTIEETVWSSIMSNLGTLNLIGNPIRCDFTLKWMYEIGSTRPSRLSGECETPSRLKGKSVFVPKGYNLKQKLRILCRLFQIKKL